MSAKITITGARSGKLRKNDRYYSFEIETGGSANAPNDRSGHTCHLPFVSLDPLEQAFAAVLTRSQKRRAGVAPSSFLTMLE